MGLREVVLLGIVLLVSGGNLSAATQTQFNFTTNDTLNQTSQEEVPVSAPLPRSHVSYRLRIYQLRKSAADEQKPLPPPVGQMQPLQNPLRSEAGELTSQQLEQRETGQAQELLKTPIRGPDLSPPFNTESKVLVMSEQRVPMPATSVAPRCGEEGVIVEVKQNFLGNGQLIRPSDLTLGGCPALHTTNRILHFQTMLQGCGSTLTMTEESLVYSFSLTYSPTPIVNTVIFKTNPVGVVIECHYRRKHYVSSNALRPTWKTHASKALAEKQLRFSLRLMTEDWQSQRPSNVFFLSDVMHIEAAVLQGHHLPLRVYVDNCVATSNPDPSSQPRYPFISNHGCLSDGKMTGAKSYFMPRSHEDKLHFQLKAFRFEQDHRNSLYITCHLKATTPSVPIDSQHKACSFLAEVKRWVASGGDNKVCSCCETSCSEQRRKRRLAADAGFPSHLQWEGMAALGPTLLEDNVTEEELSVPFPEPSSHLRLPESAPAASFSSITLTCRVGVSLALVLLFYMVSAICSRIGEPTGSTVCV